MAYGLPKIQEKSNACKGSKLGKHHRQPFPKEGARRAREILELVHINLCGPMKTLYYAQNIYFIH